jgi:hypothetical protein
MIKLQELLNVKIGTVTDEEFHKAFEEVAEVANVRVFNGIQNTTPWWTNELQQTIISNRSGRG